MDMDYRLSDLDWHKEDFLGSGVFADVFKGRLKMSNRTEDVALKYCKDPLSEKVVSDILLATFVLTAPYQPLEIQEFSWQFHQPLEITFQEN
jgi:hypothetical protein